METVFSCQLSKMKEEIKLRPLNLEDEIWIQETFPDYTTQVTTESVDMAVVTAIIYRSIENKELFTPVTVSEINTDGNAEEVRLGGLNLLRRNVINQADVNAMLTGFVAVLDKSRPTNLELVKKKKNVKGLIILASLTLSVLAIAGLIAKSWGLL